MNVEIESEATFATKLMAKRKALGFTQVVLAKRSGLSQCEISYLETGRREPTWATVKKLAEALEVSVEEFA